PAGPFSLITSSVSPSGCHLPQRGRQVHWTVFRALEPPEGDLEKPHFAAYLTSENPVKPRFLYEAMLAKTGFFEVA
ncbi:MAG: hypothetical protein IKE76_06515, partial [Clostridia bacterium]|nr:hypothetical protein [Clostridia bacterium]